MAFSESSSDHRLLAVDAVHPGADQQAEQEVGHEGRCRRDAEAQRRVGQLVDEQRYGPLRERAAQVRDRLADPELLEVGAHDDLTQDLEELVLLLRRERVDRRVLRDAGDQAAAQPNTVGGQADDSNALVVLSPDGSGRGSAR